MISKNFGCIKCLNFKISKKSVTNLNKKEADIAFTVRSQSKNTSHTKSNIFLCHINFNQILTCKIRDSMFKVNDFFRRESKHGIRRKFLELGKPVRFLNDKTILLEIVITFPLMCQNYLHY
jgi:hypothetical protein